MCIRDSHCIAATHADYGKYEPTNELFYPEFDAELLRRFPKVAADTGGSVLTGVLMPQMKRIIVQSLLSARGNIKVSTDYYCAFQLLGYDFLVDDNLRVWLCEINASPAVADELLPGLVDALMKTAVDPYCPPIETLIRRGVGKQAPSVKSGFETGCFERLYRNHASTQ